MFMHNLPGPAFIPVPYGIDQFRMFSYEYGPLVHIFDIFQTETEELLAQITKNRKAVLNMDLNDLRKDQTPENEAVTAAPDTASEEAERIINGEHFYPS